MRSCVALALLGIAAIAAEDAAAAKAEEPKRVSTLAPVIRYLDLWQFLHGGDDVKLPKVLFVPHLGVDEPESKEAPSWLSSAAMAFKDGRVKSVAFAQIQPKDAGRTGSRLELEMMPALIAIVPDGHGRGRYWVYDGPSLTGSGGGTIVRGVKEWVRELIGERLSEESSRKLPALPEPTRPRKQAPISLDEFTHETLSHGCYGASHICIFALMAKRPGDGCPPDLVSVAKKYRNDPITFGCVGAEKQTDFLKAWGVDEAALPALVALKGQRKKRFTIMEGELTMHNAGKFVDDVISGNGGFRHWPAPELPELEPPYLLYASEDKQEL